MIGITLFEALETVAGIITGVAFCLAFFVLFISGCFRKKEDR